MGARRLLIPSLVAAFGAALVAWNALLTPAFSDYEIEAEPAFDALRAGDLHGFATHAPLYAGSLVIRAPFVLASDLLGGGALAAYRAAALPCLIAAVALAVFLFAQIPGRGRWLALGLAACNPITLRALEIGHPEELLGAVLCAAAVICALRGAPGWSGLLLGLAIGNKAWAVIAIGPVLLALDHGRLRAIAIAGATAAALLAPLAIQGADTVSANALPQANAIFQPWQVWWFLGDHGAPVHGTFGIKEGYRTGPLWVAGASRVVILALAAVLAIVFWRLRRPRVDALGLLTLLMALRCVVDSWNAVYYCLPLLIALLAWEVLSRRRAPIFTAAVTAATWISFEIVPKHLSPDAQSLIYLGWMLPLIGLIALRLLRPAAVVRAELRVRAALSGAMPSLVRAPSPRVDAA